MTGLATATFPDGTLPPVDDVMRIAANLFSAGGETTARLMSTSFRILGDRPDLQQVLRDEPDKIPAFIEEALRLESPIKGEFRLSRVPVTVGGIDLPAGTTAWVMNGAANRDPRQFDDPHEFRLDRVNGRQHVAFGHGIHSCAGAPLARAETRITIERFLGRTEDITISEAAHGPTDLRRYEYDPTYMLRGLKELHLEFTPAA
jgi:cytochrome P450